VTTRASKANPNLVDNRFTSNFEDETESSQTILNNTPVTVEPPKEKEVIPPVEVQLDPNYMHKKITWKERQEKLLSKEKSN